MKLKVSNKIYDLTHPHTWDRENTIFLRGRTREKMILLPEQWEEIVDLTSLTVHLTQVGADQRLVVKRIQGREIHLETNGLPVDAYYIVYGQILDTALVT